MRSSIRRLATATATAKIKQSSQPARSSAEARFLQPGQPTGLTGLRTHPTPRSTLIHIYSKMLHRLLEFPEHSVYRQSLENLTRHRLSIMEELKPEGWDEWAVKAREIVQKYPSQFKTSQPSGTEESIVFVEIADAASTAEGADRLQYRDWGGEEGQATLEGSRLEHEGLRNARQTTVDEAGEKLVRQVTEGQGKHMHWEQEPVLSAEQINIAEEKLGAGLIEEVIQVAEGELHLLDTLIEAKVWEPLVEVPEQGQWKYFERS